MELAPNQPVGQRPSADQPTSRNLAAASRASLTALSRYQIREELGRGAMGAVYKAFDPVIARTVALKTILIDTHAPDRAHMVERLKQEAKAAGGLDHPNIITIYDVGEENGAIYLSMQFVKGTTLAARLADVGMPPLATLLSWADQISAAVGFAHARGVVHRDLKPANIMVTDEGAIKVLDFGIAKIDNTSLTQTGMVVGTPGYMAPEQITGKKVDHRADIFSLGAVFYELLTREKAFAGDIATVLYKIVNEDPVAPSLINPAIPGGTDAVIRRALAKDPKDRFQTCEEMRQALLEQSVRAALTPPARSSPEKVVAKRPPTPSGRRAPQPKETPPRIWPRLILGSAVLLMAAASWSHYIRSRTATPALQPVVGQSSSNHPTNESASVSAGPASSPSVETSPKPVDPPQISSPQAIESSDQNQAAVDNSTVHDSVAAPSSASRYGEQQTAPPATPNPPARKSLRESPLTVEGFGRQDIPDLLRQADSSTARGNYRLAGYEYGLVLKLDRNNAQAREGLRRLLVAWQSRRTSVR